MIENITERYGDWFDEADLDSMVQGYTECAIWLSTHDDIDEPLHETGAEIAGETLEQMRLDCLGFLVKVKAEFGEIPTRHHPEYDSFELLGHDFWLTRNRHGMGFWDHEYSLDSSKRVEADLTRLANEIGECWLYVGDDGLVYQC